jgi:hypothetical protein
MIRHVRLNNTFFFCLLLLPWTPLIAQGVAVPGDPCKRVSTRTQEIGCWILADNPVGPFTKAQVFWHLDQYPTRTAAQADKGPRGVVVESFGKVWLMTIEDEDWRSGRGNPVAKNWTASDRGGRKVLGPVNGGGLHPWNDSARTRPLWPGGLVRSGRRNLPGDLRWPHADRSARGTWGHRFHGIIDASHRHRHRAASFDRPHPPSVVAATDHDGP